MVDETSTSKSTLQFSGNDLLNFHESATEEEMDVDEETERETPCPMSHSNSNESDNELTDIEQELEDNEAFKTPLATLSKNAKKLKAAFVEQSEDEIEVEDVPTETQRRQVAKGKGSVKVRRLTLT